MSHITDHPSGEVHSRDITLILDFLEECKDARRMARYLGPVTPKIIDAAKTTAAAWAYLARRLTEEWKIEQKMPDRGENAR
jgi:hypothetical protein